MNRIFRNALFVLAAGALAASCADYNETDGFAAQPDPTFAEPYKDLAPVKSYIDRNQYPNMTLGAMLKVSEFNRQELAHAAAVTNFDNVAFGTTLMSGTIVNAKGVMNFLDMSDLLTHVEEIGYEVYGSPIVANANQAEEWLATLTAPIEIAVDYVEGKTIDFSTMTKFDGTVEKGDKSKASIVSYEGQNVLQVGTRANVRIVEDFDVDPKATYTTTFWARAQAGKESVSFTVNFSGNQIAGPASEGKWTVKPDKWYKIVVEGQSAPDATEGFFRIDNGPNGVIYIQKVQVGYYPDNHRDQTQQELTDTINYALNTWCDGLMKINAGRIQMFDLIDEPIETGAELENGMYDLKHSTEKIFWQDILGSENYAPAVAKAAREAYQRYEGDPAESANAYNLWVDNGDGTWTYRFNVYDGDATYYIWEEALPGYTSDTDAEHPVQVTYTEGGTLTSEDAPSNAHSSISRTVFGIAYSRIALIVGKWISVDFHLSKRTPDSEEYQSL